MAKLGILLYTTGHPEPFSMSLKGGTKGLIPMREILRIYFCELFSNF